MSTTETPKSVKGEDNWDNKFTKLTKSIGMKGCDMQKESTLTQWMRKTRSKESQSELVTDVVQKEKYLDENTRPYQTDTEES